MQGTAGSRVRLIMSTIKSAWKKSARHYWVWWLYHLVVADAVAVQRPTKYKFVRDFLGDNLGITADIGCGPGVFVRHMSARARYLMEIDLDHDSLERVQFRHRDLRNVAFVTASANTLPFTDECLDTILFLEVLEHLTDDSAALAEISRVLRPHGRLILSVPVPPGEVDEDSAWGHKREGYQLPEIKSLLVDNGFEVRNFAFAEFRFSRRAARVIRWWRQATRLPAPIFFSWIGYIDHFLDPSKVKTGSHCPATVLLLARKPPEIVRPRS
jgi:SAM-dependent methyltransferase